MNVSSLLHSFPAFETRCYANYFEFLFTEHTFGNSATGTELLSQEVSLSGDVWPRRECTALRLSQAGRPDCRALTSRAQGADSASVLSPSRAQAAERL